MSFASGKREELQSQGMSTFNLFAEAGRGFAAHAVEQIQESTVLLDEKPDVGHAAS